MNATATTYRTLVDFLTHATPGETYTEHSTENRSYSTYTLREAGKARTDKHGATKRTVVATIVTTTHRKEGKIYSRHCVRSAHITVERDPGSPFASIQRDPIGEMTTTFGLGAVPAARYSANKLAELHAEALTLPAAR